MQVILRDEVFHNKDSEWNFFFFKLCFAELFELYCSGNKQV